MLTTNTKREVRFFPDWGHRWPLWESGTDKYTMEPSDYNFSDELTARLREYYDFWEQHLDPFKGWDSPENLARHVHERAVLADMLRSELPPEIGLRLN